MTAWEKREGEAELTFDPAETASDARLVFVGRVRSPWTTREACPKNMAAARERGAEATIEIEPDFRPGLAGLERASHVAILTWLDRSRRNLIVQKPRHALTAKGVFALRSPQRPNPVGLHVARIVALDGDGGRLVLEGIDALDGTPVIDIKPYYPNSDAVADAIIGRDDA